MYPKFFVAALVASFAALASASPNPLPTPAPEFQPQLQERQDVGSIFDSLTSQAASVITGDGASVFSQATSALGSVGSEITGAQIVTRITSVAGQAVSVVTSVGGEAITLATNGAVTSVFGSIYTVATAAVQSSNNAALGMHAAGLSSPAIVGLVTVMSSALLGAAIVF